jgi:hypothetical protein
MDVKALITKWDRILTEGNQIASKKVKAATAIMLENQENYLKGPFAKEFGLPTMLSESGVHIEGAVNRAGSYATNGDFYQIAIPMVRRTFPELVAHELVGVQPMIAPVGMAFALRYRAGQAYTGGASHGTELGYNTVDKDYTYSATTSAQEALGSKAGSGVGNDFGIGIGAGTHIKEVGLTLEKATVEAKTRKLRARWSQEVAQDLKAMHGLDLEGEMMDILSYEITQEIDRELMYTIQTVATASTSTSAGWNYLTADGRWEHEKYRVLYNFLIRKANEIAITTRRGSGNWVVADPTVSAIFEASSAFTIAPVPNSVNTALTGVAKVGALDGRLQLFRDTFQTTTSFIIGFKGASEFDTGIIYLPYISLMASRATFEDSFNPTIGLMSRYAIHQHMFGAALYYRYVVVKNFS